MAPWPFGGSSPSSPRKEEPKPATSTLSLTDYLPSNEHFPIILPTILSTFGILGLVAFYARFLRRIPNTAHIRPSAFRRRTVFGRVTSVGDGDGFHLYHTPGGKLAGWGWLRSVPSTRAQLKNQTIPIRLAGVDAPEGAHFGRPAQPFSSESLSWLSTFLLNRPVRAHIHKRDQYDRVVATVYVRRGLLPFRRDVGLEMLKRGLATTYEGKTGAEFGGKEVAYKAAEGIAKKKRLGMWGGKKADFESPAAYKARMKGEEGNKA